MKKNLKVKNMGKDYRTRELCRRLKTTGNLEEKARIQKELLELHSGLINKMAHKHASGTFTVEDLKDAIGEISLAMLGLFDSFDTEGPTAFSTFAHVSLTGVMKNWKKRNLLIIIPNNADHQWVEANRGKDTFVNPKTGEEEDIIFSIRAMVKGISSIDYKPNEDGTMQSDSLQDESTAFEDMLDNLSFYAALESLTEMEAAVVEKYFVEDKSYKQIAKEFGCTHQYIGQSMNKAKRKLKTYYERMA